MNPRDTLRPDHTATDLLIPADYGTSPGRPFKAVVWSFLLGLMLAGAGYLLLLIALR
jgi:hypothetical protein